MALDTPTTQQQRFLDLTDREAFFGVADGGGKTTALMLGAVRVAAGGGQAALFRHTYIQLVQPGGMVEMAARQLRNTDATWNERRLRWDFPNGGVLAFHYLERPDDIERSHGTEYGYIGLDEVGQFRPHDRAALLTRLRLSPGYLRYAGSDLPRWLSTRLDGSLIVAATAVDNPHLNLDGYRAALDLVA